MKKLIAHRLTRDSHPALIEELRLIYNENIGDLATHPLQWLAPEVQQEWWKNLDHPNVVVHLYSPVETPWVIVAFSKVTFRLGGYATPQFAIAKGYWGRGWGSEIIAHYLQVANRPLYGEQLVANAAICHLNKRFGWRIIETEAGVDYLYHPGVSTPEQADMFNRQQEIYDEIIRYHEEGP